MSDTPQFPKTHNLSVTAPADAEVLSDLERRHAKLAEEYAQFEADLAGYPETMTYPADLDIAQALQDLLSKMKGHKVLIAALKKAEKQPWDKVIKVIQNFFVKRDEKIDGLLAVWGPRHEKFLEDKKDADRKAADAAAEAARQRQAEAEAAAAEAEQRRKEKEAELAAAAERERLAREAAEKAEADRKAAVLAQQLAEEEARRVAAEQAQKDREERATNAENLKAIRDWMKSAERLHAAAEADDDISTADRAQLDSLIKVGGTVSQLAGPVSTSLLLTEEQVEYVTKLKARLTELRTAQDARFTKRQQEKRAKDAAAAEAMEAELAEAREADRKAQQAARAAAEAKRLEADAAAKAARDAHELAREGIADAKDSVREAGQGLKAADKDLRDAGKTADRAEGHAAKMGRRAENMTDAEASRLRGDLGSTGSLTGHWVQYIEDENALRSVCGPLGGDFKPDDLNGAVYRYMGARRMAWEGEKVTDPALPGVVFRWETYARTV